MSEKIEDKKERKVIINSINGLTGKKEKLVICIPKKHDWKYSLD